MVDTPVEEFDPILNKEQMMDAMYKLFELYTDDTADCSNQAEFESYNILYNLGKIQYAIKSFNLINRKNTVANIITIIYLT